VCVCVCVCVKTSMLISDYHNYYDYDRHFIEMSEEHSTVSPSRTIHLTTRKPTGANLLLW